MRLPLRRLPLLLVFGVCLLPLSWRGILILFCCIVLLLLLLGVSSIRRSIAALPMQCCIARL